MKCPTFCLCLRSCPLHIIPESLSHYFTVKFYRSVELVFANRQEKDILWKQQLDELAESAGQRLETYSSSELSLQ